VGGYLVKEIGLYQTTLIPKDTRPTTVPNGYFLGANVINISRQTHRVIVAGRAFRAVPFQLKITTSRDNFEWFQKLKYMSLEPLGVILR